MQKPNIFIVENERIVGVKKSVLISCHNGVCQKFLGEPLNSGWGWVDWCWDGAHIYGSPDRKFRYTELSFLEIIKEILEAEKTLGPEFGGDSILFLNKVGERKYIPRSAWQGIIELGLEHCLEISKTLDHEIKRSQASENRLIGRPCTPPPPSSKPDPYIEPKEPEYVLDSFGMKVHPVTGQPIDTWVDFTKIPI